MKAGPVAAATVRLATRTDAAPLARMLARAFDTEPFHTWLFPDSRRRRRLATRLFVLELRNMLRDGRVYTTDTLEGAALWGPPESPTNSWRSRVVTPLVLCRILGRRTFSILGEIERLGKIRPREPHWYLSVIGVAISARGRGLGDALMRPVLELCDAHGSLAWVETADAGNHDFYRRHGFEAHGAVRLGNGPEVTGMLRRP